MTDSSEVIEEAGRTFSADELKSFGQTAYEVLGLSPEKAALIADSLVQADLWGHQSHGVMRTFWYGKRLLSGVTKGDAEPSLIVDTGPMAVLDGQDGVGQWIANRAMDEAIARAKQFGIGAVSVRNSGHFGTAMYYTRKAACADCIGVLTTNASPAMAPWGGRQKLIGNNPWSIAAPTGSDTPMVLDMANTVVARGKLYLAGKRGEPLPDGWAIDTDGVPTNDAMAGIAGNILPMAGHKGYVISVMMDVLSGVLSGGGFADDVVGPYVADKRSGAGHLAIALDIAQFRDIDAFKADMDRYIAKIKSAPKAPGTGDIYFPGEIEALNEARYRRDGIVIPEKTLAELRADVLAHGCAPL